MSSFRQKEIPTSEFMICPECGNRRMIRTVENCRLHDGLAVRRLRHFKCQACGAHLFDDDAMRRIQAEREKQRLSQAS